MPEKMRGDTSSQERKEEKSTFTTESGQRVEGIVISRYERPDLGWRRGAEIIIGEVDGEPVTSLRNPDGSSSTTYWGENGAARALQRIEQLIIEKQEPIKFAGSLATYLNLPRTSISVQYAAGEVSKYGRPGPVYSETTQESYGKAENRLSAPMSKDMALGYGSSQVPIECATDGTKWAILRSGRWYDVSKEELDKELRLEDTTS